jgi:hypothetical protein
LHSFPRSHVKLAAMPWADNVIAFQISIAERAVIVSANISNRKKLICDIEDDN